MLPEPARKLARQARRGWHDFRLARRVDEIDAFLVSYPKSGRTWLRFLLSCYFARTAKLGFEPDLQTTFKVLPNFDLDPVRGLPAAVVGRNAGRADAPLIAVSHRSYDRRFFGDKPVILLLRDPRDVCVSAFFHQTRHKKRFSGEISQFIDDRQFGLPSIIDYHNGWADGLIGRPSLVLSYEEIKRDTAGSVRRLLGFLKVPVDEAALAQAIALASFDQMKKSEQKVQISGHAYDPNDGESARMRKGKVGGFTDYLSEAEVGRIMALCRAHLSPKGSGLMALSGFAP